MIGTEAIRQSEVRAEYENAIALQRQILEDLLKESTSKEVSTPEIKKVATITIAAMEGSFSLSVAAKNVMPKGYAADGIMKLLHNYH